MSLLTFVLLLAGAVCLLGWWLLRKQDARALEARKDDFKVVERKFAEPPSVSDELMDGLEFQRQRDELTLEIARQMDARDGELPAFLRRPALRPRRIRPNRRDWYDEPENEEEHGEGSKRLDLTERLRRLSERYEAEDAESTETAAPMAARRAPSETEDAPEVAAAAEYSPRKSEEKEDIAAAEVVSRPVPMVATPDYDVSERLAPSRQARVEVSAEIAAPVARPAVAAAAKSEPTRSDAPESKLSDPLVADHPLGRIYFDPPVSMTEGEVTDMFALIVAPSHVNTVKFADVTSSKRTPEIATVVAPGLMYARVFADPVALQVIALGNDLVNVQSALGYGQWQWTVRALQPGNHKMTLRISHARPIVGGGGVYAEEVVALNRDIVISVSKKRIARAWLLSAAGVFVGAAAGQMLEAATPTVRDTAYQLLDISPAKEGAAETTAPIAPPASADPTNQ